MVLLSCTIHQPSSEIFKMFDQLLLLTQQGEVVYFGDINEKQDPQNEEERRQQEEQEAKEDENALQGDSGNNAQSLLEYCSQYGYEMEKERNPADFALEFATATNRLVEHRKQGEENNENNNNNSNESREEVDDLSLSPDTPTPSHKAATPISPISSAPSSPSLNGNNNENEASGSRRNDGKYVENVPELVQGYYQSELFRETENELENMKEVEIKPANYHGIINSNLNLVIYFINFILFRNICKLILNTVVSKCQKIYGECCHSS